MEEAPTTSLSTSDTNISPPSNTQEANDMTSDHATFASTWKTDNLETSFAPSNLPLSKVQRAWDRRPQSPFSRTKVRFGKVWKRNTNPGGPSNAPSGLFGGAFNFEMIGRDSPVKAVKKMRTGEDGSELVRDWDGRGSPRARRIVTRSSNDQELLELPEGEHEEEAVADCSGNADIEVEEEEEVSRIEISYEDGRTEEVEDQAVLAQEDWEDESMTEEDVDGWERFAELERLRREQEGHAQSAEVEQVEKNGAPLPMDELEASLQPAALDSALVETPDAIDPQEFDSSEIVVTQPARRSTNDSAEKQPEPVETAQPSAIPEGFVSPVKLQRRRPISQVRQAKANRRRTLPVSFAAQDSSNGQSDLTNVAAVTEASASDVEQTTVAAAAVEKQASEPTEDVCVQIEAEASNEGPVPENSIPDEGHWEDMDEEVATEPSHCRDVTPEPVNEEEWIPTVENTPTGSPGPQVEINPTVTRLAEQLGSPSKLPSSPVGSITGPHPRLPLRRSPRRKSSSPLKQSSIEPSSEKSHLVAFTPIKLPGSLAEVDDDGLPASPFPTGTARSADSVMEDASMPQRSSSAPPEEPQMSPHKPGYPRLSDDTAILQAFLNRAAESKNGKRVSLTAKRESLENRRESDNVRQALASPADKVTPVDVLGDLDPNSPSPRKQTHATGSSDAQQKRALAQDEDELLQDVPSPTKKTSRRSGRSKRKPETLAVTTYAGPTRISVRGSAESVVLKKSEAQETAQLTRINTRKNKGAAVLPPLRLIRMAKDSSNDSVEDVQEGDAEVERPTKIKWSETLVAFSQDPSEPEVSMLTDELHGPEPTPEPSSGKPDPDMIGVVTAVPASGTPSKPKLRRLKPPRTASTPAKAPASTDVAADVTSNGVITDFKSKPAANTRKRSRIATPAKPKGGEAASVLSDDVLTEGAPPKRTIATPTATRNLKTTPAVSKLRAPAPVSAGLSQGKENTLIASPPKKRARAPPSTAATKGFAPKLDLKKTVSVASKSGEGSKENAVPGIASPAKKGLRPNSFGLKEGEQAAKQEMPPSLGSPAKKRTRRQVD
ncbi:Hypothetical predicted protein [Lecanosticta acicola]|uniref:Uncharacterized protein n=1 Tax=Lecanosticta acicola TaxID=111012 RepID=A0AAI9EAU4_9PEZI|nr:Hypothetical predicted protein [Lecanosticta acicola]